MRTTITFSISLTPEVANYLQQLAQIQHSTRSKCISDLIRAAAKGVLDSADKTKEYQSQ